MAKLAIKTEWKIWIAFGALILCIVGYLYFASLPPKEGDEPLWKVTRALDERTLTVRGSGKVMEVRLIGLRIPASEKENARDFLAKTLQDKWIRVAPVRDHAKDGKEGMVFLASEDIIARMVRLGLAEIDRNEQAIDVRPYLELEQEARREKRGLWRQSGNGAK